MAKALGCFLLLIRAVLWAKVRLIWPFVQTAWPCLLYTDAWRLVKNAITVPCLHVLSEV